MSLSYRGTSDHSAQILWDECVILTINSTYPLPETSLNESREPADSLYLGYPRGAEYAGGVPEGAEKTTAVLVFSGETRLTGTIQAGPDSFACIPEDAPEMMRMSLGVSRSRLNRGIYDRDNDLAIFFSRALEVTIEDRGQGIFDFHVHGNDVQIVLKPEFLQKHRGLFYYKPGHYKLWQEPVAGWCSWAAHFDKLTEEDMTAAADMVAEKLLPYGCDIIQMDDGYQYIDQYNPDNWPKDVPPAEGWIKTNDKFPGGLKWLRNYIKNKGLIPGIWMSSFLPELGQKEWMVRKDGKPFKGKWVNCAIDGAIPEAVEFSFRKTFRAFKEQGWEYFKVDTIRHVLYDNYRQCPEYFASKNEVMEESFRGIFEGIKKEIGPDIFMLSCWGAIPEMAGIADGGRIGEDVGPHWDSVLRAAKYTCRFAWMNNIVWRNDPDYMCLRLPVEEGRTWASYIGLSGVMTMISDPADSYDDERIDTFRRIIPPLFIRPTTLEPVETIPALWILEVNKDFESWIVLGRFAWNEEGLPDENICFADLGLDPSNDYLVFDFWNERFVGSFKDKFPSEKLDRGHCRIYAIREKLGHPQVLSTSRHITQGGYELEAVKWDGNTLSGKLRVVTNDPVRLYVHVPEGLIVTSSSADCESSGRIAKLSVSSTETGETGWSVNFDHR